jgi:ribosomal protein S18 acetylase RimI-like enzyme/predicted nucleotidyltransferase
MRYREVLEACWKGYHKEGMKTMFGKRYPNCVKNTNEELEEDLRKWFKEKWVRFGPDGKIRGDCARGDDSEGKPKCLPQSKAHSLGKKGRASAAARKRRQDPNPERSGPAINVNTKKKSNEGAVGVGWSHKPEAIDKIHSWQNSETGTDSRMFQGYKMKFTPNGMFIYKGGDVVHKQPGDFSDPTNKDIMAAKRRITMLINKTQGVVENMDHSKDNQAVEELKAALIDRRQKLQSATDDQVYDSIDKIMTRIAKTHSISGQKLHDMWVDRYKQVPDTWIMNEDASGIDFDMQFDNDNGSFATVTARAQGRILGSVKFFMDGDTLEADMVEVDERYRGQGIAAAMYDYAKSQGYTIEKSSDLTPDGDHFWNKNRGEEPVWEQGMAEGKQPGQPVVDAILKVMPIAQEIWFHGSRATGKHRKNSDTDILVVVPDDLVGDQYLGVVRILQKLSSHFDNYDIQPTHPGYNIHLIAQEEGQLLWSNKQDMAENFADGKNPGRKGLAKRVGVNCKQPVAKLRSIAANSSGERQRMAHWCANMKSGKQK